MAERRNIDHGPDDNGGYLCPVCGIKGPLLSYVIERRVAEVDERFLVCSAGCQKRAYSSPHPQSNLFARDMAMWTRSVQGELPLGGELKDGESMQSD